MQTREKPRAGLPGVPMLLFLLAVIGLAVLRFVLSAQAQDVAGVFVALGTNVVALFCLAGLFVVNPNEGRVLQFFGKYVGTVRKDGLRWANPFFTKKRISLRVRNFESSRLKVNDLDGNPIEIAAI